MSAALKPSPTATSRHLCGIAAATSVMRSSSVGTKTQTCNTQYVFKLSHMHEHLTIILCIYTYTHFSGSYNILCNHVCIIIRKSNNFNSVDIFNYCVKYTKRDFIV